ncbi:hypothetical protein [Micromonospora carbonacea]|uniref:Uncharacterized protein n=1 Tax=Micromonospora carbonacea TaxID=47853 RepID=A0A1C4V7M3_9ACTN|nr:hypothetical protein [Micromonospora carbonacea]SCE80038.1 hypothetical protein GA0070563_10297 [Micromonospora carbonacea]
MTGQAIPERVEPGLDPSWRVDGAGPFGAFVPEGVNDRLLQVSLELAAELWLTRRRLAAIEAQLVANGTVTSPDQLPADLDPQARAARDAFVQRIFGSFAR